MLPENSDLALMVNSLFFKVHCALPKIAILNTTLSLFIDQVNVLNS